MYDLIIIGGGPAGLTASIYAIRKRLNALTITMDLGGKTNYFLKLPWIQDYQVIRGGEIVSKFKQELEYLDFAHQMDQVTHVSKIKGGFSVETRSGNFYEAKALILANGVSQRWLEIPGEKEFMGKGICYSAISYAPLFIDRDTVVFGEGELALRSAAELSTVAKKVHLIGAISNVLDTELGKKMQAAPNVEIHSEYQVSNISGEEYANHVSLDGPNGEKVNLDTECVFIEKELLPNTSFMKDLVNLDKKGRIIVNNINQTSTPGIFAAGDITNIYAEQVLVAIGEGAKAALSAYDYLLRYN
ncbi:NAD(P)/FAD-dependent oxidoreductase [bacterium]|nr:NAD(P)/FAD-dependent oxidoreductase [bacterium]